MTFADLLYEELHRGGEQTGMQLWIRLLARDDQPWWRRVALIVFGPPYSELRALARRGNIRCREVPGGPERGHHNRFLYSIFTIGSEEPPP